VHWDWTFAILGVILRLQQLSVSLVTFLRKASHSPSNAWVPKLSAELTIFYRGLTAALPGQVFKVGPLSLLRFRPNLILHRESREQFFTPAIYSRGGGWLIFTIDCGLCLFYAFAHACSAFCLASLSCALVTRGDFAHFLDSCDGSC
jgi:hypothetical protein